MLQIFWQCSVGINPVLFMMEFTVYAEIL